MINEIKEALEKATPGPWEHTDDAVRVGFELPCQYICQMYESDVGKDSDVLEDTDFENREANVHLIANTPTYIRYLLDELEKANKEVELRENKYQTMFREMLPVAQQRDKYYAELEVMRTEHTAMKEALEEIEDESSSEYADLTKINGISQDILSMLKSDTSCTD